MNNLRSVFVAIFFSISFHVSLCTDYVICDEYSIFNAWNTCHYEHCSQECGDILTILQPCGEIFVELQSTRLNICENKKFDLKIDNMDFHAIDICSSRILSEFEVINFSNENVCPFVFRECKSAIKQMFYLEQQLNSNEDHFVNNLIETCFSNIHTNRFLTSYLTIQENQNQYPENQENDQMDLQLKDQQHEGQQGGQLNKGPPRNEQDDGHQSNDQHHDQQHENDHNREYQPNDQQPDDQVDGKEQDGGHQPSDQQQGGDYQEKDHSQKNGQLNVNQDDKKNIQDQSTGKPNHANEQTIKQQQKNFQLNSQQIHSNQQSSQQQESSNNQQGGPNGNQQDNNNNQQGGSNDNQQGGSNGNQQDEPNGNQQGGPNDNQQQGGPNDNQQGGPNGNQGGSNGNQQDEPNGNQQGGPNGNQGGSNGNQQGGSNGNQQGGPNGNQQDNSMDNTGASVDSSENPPPFMGFIIIILIGLGLYAGKKCYTKHIEKIKNEVRKNERLAKQDDIEMRGMLPLESNGASDE